MSVLRLRGLAWLMWRQNRLAFWIGLGVAVAVAAYTIIQHQHIVAAVAEGHLEACGNVVRTSPECLTKVVEFGREYQFPMRRPLQLMVAVPLVFGVFLGAPLLAQELESGTYRTVCTQSVTRLRWFAAKVAVPVVMTVLISGTLAAAMTWWWQPAARVLGDRFPWYQWYPFGGIGPVVVGLSVLLLLIGIAAGLILRRTVLAMGATLVAGGLVLYVLEHVRAHLLPTRTATVQHSLTVPGLDNAWVLAEGPLSPSGRRVSDLPSCYAMDDFRACLVQHGRTGHWADFHPATQLWPLQWVEAGLCVVVAAALAALCVWWIRRRLA